MTALSSYSISWIVLTPKKGKTTKRDQKVFNSQITASSFSTGAFSQNLFAHFPTKEIAEKQLLMLKKANKSYDAVIITDKQFGNIEIDYKSKTVKIAYTAKQLESSKLI